MGLNNSKIMEKSRSKFQKMKRKSRSDFTKKYLPKMVSSSDFTEKFHQFSAQAKDIDDRTIRLVVGTELAQFHSLTPLTRLSDVGVVKHITNRLHGRITEKYRRVGGLVPRKPTN